MDKEEQNKIYKKLRNKYSDKEIAENFVFSSEMTEEEHKEFSEYLKKRRSEMTKDVIDKIRKLQNKFKKEDMNEN